MKNGPYELIVPPKDYPGTLYRGRYAYEHHVNWWKKTGKLVPKGFEIHHENGNHRDNKDKNLRLVTSSEHRKIHGKISHEKTRVPLVCPTCGSHFFKRGNEYRSRLKVGTKSFYCSRKCQHISLRK